MTYEDDDWVTYEDEGGDPVCWLELVCPECGRMREDRALDHCAYCGTPVAEPDQGRMVDPCG